MQWLHATLADAPLLAELNQQLIADEGHETELSLQELEQRMRGWLSSEYAGVLFEHDADVLGYALFRLDDRDRVHLRQFFVARSARRRGVGRAALRLLRTDIVPRGKWVILEALSTNANARAFWSSVGFEEYAVVLRLPPA